MIECKLHKKQELKSYGSGDRAGVLIKFTVLLKGFKNPTELDITAFNEKANFVSDTSIGTELFIDGYTFSKDNSWNGKQWRSTEFRLNSIEVSRNDDSAVHSGGRNMNTGYQQPTPPEFDDDPNDDLPF